jgi:hypothetical protein
LVEKSPAAGGGTVPISLSFQSLLLHTITHHALYPLSGGPFFSKSTSGCVTSSTAGDVIDDGKSPSSSVKATLAKATEVIVENTSIGWLVRGREQQQAMGT